MKKIISIFLSLVVMLSALSIGIEALANSKTEYYKNPFYSGEFHQEKFKSLYATSYSSSPQYEMYNGEKYYYENDNVYNIVRDALANRKTSVTIRLASSGRIYNYASVIERLFVEATEDKRSVCSTDGDYARWSVSEYGMDNSSFEKGENGYYYKFNLVYKYYSTAKEEQQADAKINSIVNSVRKQNYSDYEAIKYIHDYLLNCATYDYEAVKYPSKYKSAFTAYGILCRGLGVCQGYANAFYRICKELGYNVRFVSSSPYEGCHAWNLIQLDDKFYFVDATWDDEINDNPDKVEESGKNELNKYYYFLVDYDTLRSQDNNYQHTLYRALYTDDYYKDNFESKTSEQPYDIETAGLSSCKISLSNTEFRYNGKAQKPVITITDRNGNKLSSYSTSYSNSTNCGRVKISITGLGDYKNSVSYRTYNILPDKMTSTSLKKDGRTSSSIYLTWKKYAGGANGYQLQQYNDGEWKTIKTLGDVTSYKVTGLAPSKLYRFRVRAFKKINNCIYYGSWSTGYSVVTIPKKVSTPTLSTKSRSVTVKWKKVTCSGYEIQYSTNKSMKGAKTVAVSSKSNSKKISKLKKGKRYYFRVRAYKKYNDKKYCSSWSSKKSIKVK